MTTTNYRIEDKGNVNMNGKRTAFKLYEREGSSFVFQGQYTAPGHDASDEKCIAAALDKIAETEEHDDES